METQNTQKYAEEIGAWNSFIDKYKGDFKEQAAIKQIGSIRNRIFGQEDIENARIKVSKLCERVNSLNWKINTQNEDSEGKLIDIMTNENYFSELMSLPEIPSTFGVLESILENALTFAKQLIEIKDYESPYESFHVGTKFGEEIIKAYAERTFMRDVYKAQREGADKNTIKEVIQKAREKIDSYRRDREESYPNNSNISFWRDHPKEHEMSSIVTHMLNSCTGQVISSKLRQIEENLEGGD